MIELITDRSAEDVRRGTAKGFYNASDLNRVEAALAELAPLLAQEGYYVQPVYHGTWTLGDLPTQNQLAQYLGNVRQVAATFVEDERLPHSMAGLDYQKANAIENVLVLARTLLPEMQAAYRPSGTFYAGT